MRSPKAKDKPPHNVQVLQRWVGAHADAEGIPQLRVQRWISYMVVAAILDKVRDENDDPLFLLKGGVAMELRLDLKARATKDYDAAFRDASGAMIERLDDALEHGHGDFTVTRTEADHVGETDAKRLKLKLQYRGRPWATVLLEVAPVEGRVGEEIERVPAKALGPFGIDGPRDVACVSVRYQIAQKLHACTQVFAQGPPNDRFRDLIDVLLLRELLAPGDLSQVQAACIEIFDLRAGHTWPPTVGAMAGWAQPYRALATEIDFAITDVETAVTAVQRLVDEIAGAVA